MIIKRDFIPVTRASLKDIEAGKTVELVEGEGIYLVTNHVGQPGTIFQGEREVVKLDDGKIYSWLFETEVIIIEGVFHAQPSNQE